MSNGKAGTPNQVVRVFERWGLLACVIVPWLYWLLREMAIYVRLPLARDPTIFQYTAWAVGQGERLYRDIHDVNGPLITLVHLTAQALGGESARAFRTIDLSLSIGVFALLGTLIPGLVRSDEPGRSEPSTWERASWILASTVTLLSAYFLYNFWESAQRESIYFLLVLGSAMLQVRAQTKPDQPSAHGWLFAAGCLSGALCLGKPTFAAFALTQAVVLCVDGPDTFRQSFRRRLAKLLSFSVGGWAGIFAVALTSSRFADLSTWLGLLRHDVPTVYRFLPAVQFSSLWQGAHGRALLIGVVSSLVFVELVRRRLLPVRVLVLALLPLPAIANVTAQSKGFDYHYEPLVLSLRVQWLLLVAFLWQLVHRDSRYPRVIQAAAIGATLLLGARVGRNLMTSPHLEASALIDPTQAAFADRGAMLKLFSAGDSQLFDEQEVAEYLRKTTRPDERVQIFGMDPSVLFLAKRRSATPYIYAWDVVVEEAYVGAERVGASAEQKSAIRRIEAGRIADFTRRLAQNPPAKFVFPAKAQFLSKSPEQSLQTHCPAAAAWFAAHYALEQTIGSFRIYGRKAG